jgi:predicted nucleotidyltransferase
MIPIETLSKVVALWAESEPIVKTAYLFGSRVRGDNRCDSDLDVAIELVPRLCDSVPLATWIAEAARLRSSISSRIPLTVDLQWYGGAIDTPIIHTGLAAGSRTIYERSTHPSAAADAPKVLLP